MSSKSMNLDFYATVKGDVSDLAKKIESIKQQLNNLEMPQKVASGFDATLTKLKEEITSFDKMAEKGISEVGDNKKLQTSWNKILSLLEKTNLQTELIKNSGEIIGKDTAEKLNAATIALNNYDKALKAVEQTQKYQEKKGQYDTFAGIQKKKNDALKDVNATLAIAQDNLPILKNKWDNSSEKQQYDQDLKQYEKYLNRKNGLSKKLKETNSQIEELTSQGVINTKGKLNSNFEKKTNEMESSLNTAELKEAEDRQKEIIANEGKIIQLKRKRNGYNLQLKLSEPGSDREKHYEEETTAIEAQIKALKERNAALEESAKEPSKASQEIEKRLRQTEQANAALKRQKKIKEQIDNLPSKVSEPAKPQDLVTLESEEEKVKKALLKKEQLMNDLAAVQTRMNTASSEMNGLQMQGTVQQWQQLQQAFQAAGITLEGDVVPSVAVLQEKISSITAAEFAKLPPELQNITTLLNQMVPSADKTSGAMKDVNAQVKELTEKQKDLDRLKFSIFNFFSVSNAINIFKRSIHDAIKTVKDLDKAMTETAVVTNFSVADMWKELPRYTQTANELGTTTQGAYETMTLYYQQGLKTQEAFEVGTETMKMARIAGMDYAQATNLMTAALRGFNMEVNKESATKINDTYSKLAAVTAADTQEIATAMTKTASIANSAGMEFETTAAFLTQIIETTRESPETAGTAMKTVIARFQEMRKSPLEIGEVDGEKVDANKIESALRSIGVSLRDNVTGQFRELDDVFIELASKWDGLDKNTQRYIATIAAGSRQQSRFLAMMSDFERTQELIDAAENSQGASQEQFEKTLDSLETKLNKMHNAWHEFTMGIADSTTIKVGTGFLTKMLDVANKLTGNSGIAKLGLVLGGLKIGRAGLSGLIGKGFGKSLAQEFSFLGDMRKNIVDSASEEDLRAGNVILADKINLVQKLGRGVLKLGQSMKITKGLVKGSWLSSGLATGLAGGATVATILAVVAALIKAYDWYKKNFTAAGQFDKAVEANKAMQVSAEEAKQAYEDLEDTLTSLGDKASEIDKLTKGTQEWKDAVADSNSEMLKLLEATPELASAMTSKDGVLTLEPFKTQEVLDEKKRQAMIEQQTAFLIEQDAFDAQTKLYYDNKYTDNGKRQAGSLRTWTPFFKDKIDINKSDELAKLIAEGKILNLIDANEWVSKNVEGTKGFSKLNNEDMVAFRARGNVLLQREQKQRAQNDAAISSMLESIPVDQVAKDFINSMSDELSHGAYSKFQNNYLDTLKKNLKGEYIIGNYEKIAFAKSKHWQWISGNEYQDEFGQTQTRTSNQVANYLAAESATQDFAVYAETMSDLLSRMSRDKVDSFKELLSQDGEGLTTKTLDKLSQFIYEGTVDSDEEFVGKKLLSGDGLAKSLQIDGIEELADLAEAFQMSPEDFSELLANNINKANERINDQRLDITRSLIKMGAFTGINGSGFAAGEKYKTLEDQFSEDPDAFRNAYQGILTGLEQSGSAEFAKSFITNLNQSITDGEIHLEDLADLNVLSSKLDFSKPLATVRMLRKEAKDTTTIVGQMAQSILDLDSLSQSAQLKDFLQSTQYTEDISEQIQKIIDTEGDVSAENILDMANDCEDLQSILEETAMTAESLAEALEMVADGSMAINELTDTVMTAIGTFGSLESTITGTLKKAEKFDPGQTEDNAAKFVQGAFENFEDHLSRGAYGNSQMDAYMDYLFSDKWDEGLDPEARIAKLQQTKDVLEENQYFMKDLWTKAISGQDFYGNQIANQNKLFERFGLQGQMVDGNIQISELEKGALNTANLVKALQSVLNISAETAGLLIADFKNYDTQNMGATLEANDRAAGFQNAYNQITDKENGDFIYDKREAASIDKFYGVTGDDSFSKYIETQDTDKKILQTDFYTEEGTLKEGTELLEQLNEVSKFKTQNAAKGPTEEWGKQFYSNDREYVPSSNGYRGGPLFDYDAAKAQLESLGITGQDAAAAIQESFKTQVANGAEEVRVKYTNAFGDVREVAVNEGQTVEQAIAADVKATDFEGMANAFKTVFGGENEISFVATGLKDIIDNVTTMQTKAATPISIKMDAAGNAEATYNNFKDKTVNITYRAKLRFFAKGTKGAKKSEVALTGEEGPELVQSGNHAYITGSKGPEMAYIKKGDVVYTASETKKILGSSKKKGFKAYSGGTIGSYGDAKAPDNKKNSSSGSRGSKKDKEEKPWDNPFDALYNLLRQIDEQLRERNRIERSFQNEIKSLNTNARKLADLTVKELAQLDFEKQAQQALRDRRNEQIDKFEKENSSFNQYAKTETDPITGERVLRIDWEAINEVTDQETGKDIEEYVKQLEEWTDDINKAEETLNDIDDKIEEIKEQRKEDYLKAENRIKEALLKVRQQEIEQLQKIGDSITDSNSKIISAMEKSISKMREERENEKTEKDLQEKYRRLGYLSQDTSNANDLEIFNLEKELEEQQEDYTNTLIDQKITQLQDQNDFAADQRNQEIEILNTQLEQYKKTGAVFEDVQELLHNSIGADGNIIDGSNLENLLKKADNWSGLSKTMQTDWAEKFQNEMTSAMAYIWSKDSKFQGDIGKIVETVQGVKNVMDNNEKGKSSGGSGGGGSGSGGSGSGESNKGAGDNKYTGRANFAHYYARNGKIYHYTDTYTAYSSSTQNDADDKADKGAKRRESETYDQAKREASRQKPHSSGGGNITRPGKNPHQSISKYASGGLADFTGPAWLDGTKSKPELVLNARDTQNFIQLKDILGNFMNNKTSSAPQNSGEISYDIDINVEKISDDYDVEKIADKIKRLINADARYRNNNTIGSLR